MQEVPISFWFTYTDEPQTKFLQRLPGAAFHALQTEDTLRSVFSLSGIIRYIYIHRTHPLTLSTGNTFAFVALDPQQGIITHRLQKHRDRADIFAECTVVLKTKREVMPTI